MESNNSVYSSGIEEMLKILMERIQKEEEEYLVIRGDFNVRTGSEEGPLETERGKAREIRKLKDKIINKGGRVLINKVKERD